MSSAERVGFRVAAWDTPLRVNPNRHAGRWNLADSEPTQYICLHPLSIWAEYLRWHGIKTEERAQQLRLGVWALRVDRLETLRVGFDNANELDLRPEDLVADEWAACQAAAERLRRRRSAPKAIEVPSAALPGTRNLVVFGPLVAMPYGMDPLDDVDVPLSLAAAGARPPASLLTLVRHRGERHAELDAWARGESYTLIEPADSLLADEQR